MNSTPSTKVVVWIRLNVFDTPERDDSDWYTERFRLWSRYTYPSLLAQTYEDFEAWIIAVADRKEHAQRMRAFMPDPRFRLVYDPAEAAGKIRGFDRYVVARIDTDDIYHRDVLRLYVINSADMGDKTHIQLADGYLFYEASGQLWDFKNSSPAFFCKVIGPAWCENGKPHLGHHGRIAPVSKRLHGKRFVVVCHGGNLKNRPRRGRLGKEYAGAERKTIFKEFGIECA